ncbi:sensor domain-containing diguanylate cyclase [Aeromonas sp. FDAARGOS 1415]|uniref:sensor domain-containing diguanylate cyclase n=1 Tax=Aeromonas TaxID=642 RepID=UPI001C2245F4|nr:sensor domain-containing diguanylate cyclase [Aeromonas sp. FDAARGOS 1415]QXB54047.1 sensor domain-containing diguanylate cyclase [Aeromonas sp. FDAARGOS 1415]
MHSHWLLRFDLHRLILSLAVIGVLATFGNSFYAIHQAQRQLLIDNTLEANRVYAAKLAASADAMLSAAQGQLAYSASQLAPLLQADDIAGLEQEVTQLRRRTNTFNSVAVVNTDSTIIAVSPETLNVKGAKLTSPNARRTLKNQKPVISDPLVSLSGNYLISLSYPVFAADGRYLGYVAGTIYLESASVLSHLLGQHYYQDGSYLYVVDRQRTLIYHPDPERIGQKVGANRVVDEVLQGEQGALAVRNSDGNEMLSGFAPVTGAGWGVVAQRPRSATLAGLDQQMIGILKGMVPVTLFILFFIWLSATIIARPLRQLANRARLMDQQEAATNISGIRAWYFEAAQLKHAILKGLGLLNTKIDKLHTASHTDPMTGLFNRRAMQQMLDGYQDEHQPLAVIALDIDHFKSINDRFGHDVGDAVIIALADLMRQEQRAGAALCRSGGEEFLLLLPGVSLSQAAAIAERLRTRVASHEMETAGHITLSLGVAHWGAQSGDLAAVLKQADKALYDAKHGGRNCVVVASD